MKILIVDDVHFIHEFLAEVLTEVGYKVFSAYSAEEALLLINREVFDMFDLVITDTNMSRMSGFDLVNEVRKTFPKQKFVGMSGSPSNRKEFSAVSVPFLSKPIENDELLKLVRELIGE